MADLPAAAPAAPLVFGLEELLSLASERLGEKVTPRTVRLYATEGLIDRPGKDGRRAVYGAASAAAAAAGSLPGPARPEPHSHCAAAGR